MLFGTRSVLREEEGEGTGGGGGKTFTQAELDAHIKTRLKSKDAELAKLKTDLEGRPTSEQFEELQTKLTQIEEEHALKDSTALERAEHEHKKRIERADRKNREMEKKIAALTQANEHEKLARQAERSAKVFGESLDAHGVLSTARPHAIRVLMHELGDTIETEQDGSLSASWGELVNATPKEIAGAFLKASPHFVEAPTGGAGTPRPKHGTPHQSQRSAADMSVAELAAEAGPDPSAPG